MYASGMCLKYWAVLDLARLGKGEYEAMVKELVNKAKGVRNKLGLSWAKLSSSLASYGRCANCFQDCQYSHLNLVILVE